MVSAILQVAVVVPDLELAMDELGRARGMTWTPPRARTLDGSSYRTCWSREGPPYFELIEGAAGTPWDCSDGPHIDHIAWWSDDLAADIAKHERAGLHLEFDHRLRGSAAAYLRAPATGLRIQLVDRSYRSVLEEELGFPLGE